MGILTMLFFWRIEVVRGSKEEGYSRFPRLGGDISKVSVLFYLKPSKQLN
jgi:hypothetical protein